MIISVASGKGGTGKTAIATSLPFIIENSIYVDMDAEEPNGHIILRPKIEKEENFCMPVPYIDAEKCTYCGKCAQNCKYGAIAIIKKNKKRMFFKKLCHSCGVCSFVCPKNAIIEKDEIKGVIRYGKAGKGFSFMDASLNVGEASSTRMLSYINKKIVGEFKEKNIIIDTAPGTACPVVEALKESDFALLVAEPTLFSLNDLKLLIELIEKMEKPFGIVVNKAEKGNSIIQDYAEDQSINIAGEIPFSLELAQHYSEGKPVIEYGFEDELKKIIESIKIIRSENERNTCIKR